MLDRLVFVPLGGVGEIGMNVYLYGLDEPLADGRPRHLGFADERLPGVDIVLPDMQFIEELGDKLTAWSSPTPTRTTWARCPICGPAAACRSGARRFTAAVLRPSWPRHGLASDVPIKRHRAAASRSRSAGFACRFLHVTHSIPEPTRWCSRRRFGRVLHTGDWKLDPAPLVGERTDVEALEHAGQGGRARDGVRQHQRALARHLGLRGRGAGQPDRADRGQPNRVVLTSFASNIARMETAMLAAHAAGRELFVVGRSMRRMIDAAREVGYLKDMPPIRDEREADSSAAQPRALSLHRQPGRGRECACPGSPAASTRGCGSSPATP